MMKTLVVMTLAAALLAGCSDENGEEGDATSAKLDSGPADLGPLPGAAGSEVARESLSMEQVRLKVLGLVGVLQANAAVRDLLEGKDIFGSKAADAGAGGSSTDGCLSLLKQVKPPTLTVTFTCPNVRGTVVLTQQGVVGAKYVRAVVGGASGHLEMGSLSIGGSLRLKRKLLGSYDVATCGGACGTSEAYKQGDACKKGSKICLVVKPKNSEKDVLAGFYGTVKREVKLTQKTVQVTVSGAGTVYREPDSERLMATGKDAGPPSMTGLLQVMDVGSWAKAETCGSGGISAAKALTFDIPLDLKSFSCVCPSAGTLSAKGDVWSDVGVDCDKDGMADLTATVLYKEAGDEVTFGSSCGVSAAGTASCAKGGKVRFQDADFKLCGGLGKAMCLLSGVKSALGCEDDHCTICHKEVDLASLKKSVADWKAKHTDHDWTRLDKLVGHLVANDVALKAKVVASLAQACKK